MAFIFH